MNISICSFCERREAWTILSQTGMIVRQKAPAGWHSPGISPGFCSDACSKNYHLMKSIGEQAEEFFRQKILNPTCAASEE